MKKLKEKLMEVLSSDYLKSTVDLRFSSSKKISRHANVVDEIKSLVSSSEKMNELMGDLENIMNNLQLESEFDDTGLIQEVRGNAEQFKSSLQRLIDNNNEQLSQIEQTLKE